MQVCLPSEATMGLIPVRTQQEVAEILHITRQRVDQIEREALKKIKRKMLACQDVANGASVEKHVVAFTLNMLD